MSGDRDALRRRNCGKSRELSWWKRWNNDKGGPESPESLDHVAVSCYQMKRPDGVYNKLQTESKLTRQMMISVTLLVFDSLTPEACVSYSILDKRGRQIW